MQLTSAILDRTDLKETACNQRAQDQCFRNSGVERSKGKRRKWTFREAHIWPPGFRDTYSDPHSGSVDRERVQEVGTEGKPKTVVSDFLVTGWLCKLSICISTHRRTGPPATRDMTLISTSTDEAWDRLMRQSAHQRSTSNPAGASSSPKPVCPTVTPFTDVLKVNLLEDRICAVQTPYLPKHYHQRSHWGTQKTQTFQWVATGTWYTLDSNNEHLT